MGVVVCGDARAAEAKKKSEESISLSISPSPPPPAEKPDQWYKKVGKKKKKKISPTICCRRIGGYGGKGE